MRAGRRLRGMSIAHGRTMPDEGPCDREPRQQQQVQAKTATHNRSANQELPAELVAGRRRQTEPIGDDNG